jgi:hypothetical protein
VLAGCCWRANELRRRHPVTKRCGANWMMIDISAHQSCNECRHGIHRPTGYEVLTTIVVGPNSFDRATIQIPFRSSGQLHHAAAIIIFNCCCPRKDGCTINLISRLLFWKIKMGKFVTVQILGSHSTASQGQEILKKVLLLVVRRTLSWFDKVIQINLIPMRKQVYSF